MAKTDFVQTVVMVSSASGGSATIDMTQYITAINGFKVNAMNQETHTMGDAWVEKMYTGVRSGDDITISGFYDDATSGPHAYFGHTTDIGAERKMSIRFATADSVVFQYLQLSYSRKPVRNELTAYEMVCSPTGAITTST